MTPSLCLACQGSGITPQFHAGVLTSEPLTCSDCRGSGQVEDTDDLDVCERCGERGQMKHGDPDDCRSPSCMGERCDAAMDALEDR